MNKRILTTIAIIIFGIIAIYGFSGQSGEVGTEWRDAINWADAGISHQEVVDIGKPIYLFVSTEWCTFCKKMKSSTFTDDHVQRQLNDLFVAVSMNPEVEGIIRFTGEELSYRDLAVRLGVSGYPASFFFTPHGELIGGQSGYLDKDQFALIGEYVGEGYYTEYSFAEFQQLPDDRKR